jgi:hypothetical protein
MCPQRLEVAMVSARFLIAMSGAISLCTASVGASLERTAYVLQDEPETFVRVSIPVSGSGYAQRTPISSFDWTPTGSTILPDGRIVTLNSGNDQLVAIMPGTGQTEVLCNLSVDVQPGNELLWGIDGRLRFYRSDGGLAELDLLDPDDCALTMEAAIPGYFTSIESHEGQYYAGGHGAFWRIDPQTYEVTLIKDYNGFGGTLHIWGLASVGSNLWCGATIISGGPDVSQIGLIDPATGDQEVFVLIADSYMNMSPYLALQVIEQPGPPQVPAVTPVGILVLVLGLGAAGLAALRWR